MEEHALPRTQETMLLQEFSVLSLLALKAAFCYTS